MLVLPCFRTKIKLILSTNTGNLTVLEMALPFPVTVPSSGTVRLWIPLFLEAFPILQSQHWKLAILPLLDWNKCDSFCPIFGMRIFQFQCSHSSSPVPVVDSMHLVPFPVRGYASSGMAVHWKLNSVPVRLVPFPVRGYASSGTDIHRALFRNWVLSLGTISEPHSSVGVLGRQFVARTIVWTCARARTWREWMVNDVLLEVGFPTSGNSV